MASLTISGRLDVGGSGPGTLVVPRPIKNEAAVIRPSPKDDLADEFGLKNS
jgi:hypothetical protein